MMIEISMKNVGEHKGLFFFATFYENVISYQNVWYTSEITNKKTARTVSLFFASGANINNELVSENMATICLFQAINILWMKLLDAFYVCRLLWSHVTLYGTNGTNLKDKSRLFESIGFGFLWLTLKWTETKKNNTFLNSWMLHRGHGRDSV